MKKKKAKDKEKEIMTVSILLLIVLGLLALCTWNGYRKGFLKIVLSMVAMVATVIIGIWINPYVSQFLKERTTMYETLQKHSERILDEMIGEELKNGITSRTEQMNMIENLNLPESIKKILIENNNNGAYQLLSVDNFEGYISNYLAGVMLNSIAFVGSFLIVGFLIKIVFVMADIVGRIPGIKGLNKMIGGVIGFLQGILILWILCLIVTAFIGTSWGKDIMGEIQKSQILSFIYDHNYLLKGMSDILKLFQ